MMKKIASWFGRLFLCGILGLVFLMSLDLVMWWLPPHRGWAFWQWNTCGPISVGDNYSIIFLTRNAHIFLAEYDQAIEIYGGTEREAKRIGNLNLHMNTGGRTDVKLRSGVIDGRRCIQVIDRFGVETIDLEKNQIIQSPYLDASKSVDDKSFYDIGRFSGESFPLKYVPNEKG